MENDNRKLLREFMIFESFDVTPLQDEGDGIVRMKGVIQRANSVNSNGRVYPRTILEREDKNMQDAISDRHAVGELDHPDSSVVQLENGSHLITKTWWDGDDLLGEIEVLDTPKGKILESYIRRKVKLGISSRGLGSTHQTTEGSEVVEDDFQLLTYDMVSQPSVQGAFMYLKESREYKILVEANREFLLNDILDNILDLGD